MLGIYIGYIVFEEEIKAGCGFSTLNLLNLEIASVFPSREPCDRRDIGPKSAERRVLSWTWVPLSQDTQAFKRQMLQQGTASDHSSHSSNAPSTSGWGNFHTYSQRETRRSSRSFHPHRAKFHQKFQSYSGLQVPSSTHLTCQVSYEPQREALWWQEMTLVLMYPQLRNRHSESN